jgi:hypothetical protein
MLPMKEPNHKKTYIAVTFSLLFLLALLFGILTVLAYFQNNRPDIYDNVWKPLVALLALDAVASVVVIIVFGKKALIAEIMYRREKLQSRAEPYEQSLRPRIEYDMLFRLIKTDMEKDGFTVIGNVDLHPDAQTALAYKVRFTLAKDFVGEYVFLIRADKDISDEIDLSKADEIIESTHKKRRVLGQTDNVALCLFQEKVGEELANEIQECFSRELQFILAVYELSTGRVYFMNGRDSRFSQFTKLQGLIRKYIVGEKREQSTDPK